MCIFGIFGPGRWPNQRSDRRLIHVWKRQRSYQSVQESAELTSPTPMDEEGVAKVQKAPLHSLEKEGVGARCDRLGRP